MSRFLYGFQTLLFIECGLSMVAQLPGALFAALFEENKKSKKRRAERIQLEISSEWLFLNVIEGESMRLDTIPFDDDAFKAAVMATGEENSESVTAIKARRKSIKSVKGIEYFPNLQFLDLTRNQIAELDLQGNRKLKQLFVGNNRLESIDLSGLRELEDLEVFMNDIEELDLSENTLLEVLYANANDFVALDLSNNDALTDVQLNDNSLKSLLLPQAMKLEYFRAENNVFSDEQKAELTQKLGDCELRL